MKTVSAVYTAVNDKSLFEAIFEGSPTKPFIKEDYLEGGNTQFTVSGIIYIWPVTLIMRSTSPVGFYAIHVETSSSFYRQLGNIANLIVGQINKAFTRFEAERSKINDLPPGITTICLKLKEAKLKRYYHIQACLYDDGTEWSQFKSPCQVLCEDEGQMIATDLGRLGGGHWADLLLDFQPTALGRNKRRTYFPTKFMQ